MPECSQEDFESALKALRDSPVLLSARDWSNSSREKQAEAGLYSWWADEEGAKHLSECLTSAGELVSSGMIYAGQAGATLWPSGKRSNTTLKGRVDGLHFGGNIRGSTLRLSLAAMLRQPLELRSEGRKRLEAASEAKLTNWIEDHLKVAIFPFANRDTLGDLERRVLQELNPPLNLKGMKVSSVRTILEDLRREISSRIEGHSPCRTVGEPMPFDNHCSLWPNGDKSYFRDRELQPRRQVGPTCVASTLAVLTGRPPAEFIGRINTQDPSSWSDVLVPMGMQLAYCPTDLRRLKHYLPELLRLDDLFTLSYYTTQDPDDLLGDPDEHGWLCGSHVVVLHRDRIYDPGTGEVCEARDHSGMEYHTKRIFRVVPAGHTRRV